MNHVHNNHCAHNVMVCSHCDVAYCTKCRKEWGAACTQNHYPYYWWNTQPPYTTTTTGWTGNSDDLTLTTTLGSYDISGGYDISGYAHQG